MPADVHAAALTSAWLAHIEYVMSCANIYIDI